MKSKRLAKIIELIQNNDIETQEELCKKLEQAGFTTTQATVSRDMKELKVIKVQNGNGGYKYAIGGEKTEKELVLKFNNILKEAIIKVDYVDKFVVIKCYPGMAQAAAAPIDSMKMGDIVGTLAGDDTVFIITRTMEAATQIVQSILRIIK